MMFMPGLPKCYICKEAILNYTDRRALHDCYVHQGCYSILQSQNQSRRIAYKFDIDILKNQKGRKG